MQRSPGRNTFNLEDFKAERYQSQCLKSPGEIQRLWSMAGHCWPGRNKPLTQNPINCYKFFTISCHISQQSHPVRPAVTALTKTHAHMPEYRTLKMFFQTSRKKTHPAKLKFAKFSSGVSNQVLPHYTLQLHLPAVFLSGCFNAVPPALLSTVRYLSRLLQFWTEVQ